MKNKKEEENMVRCKTIIVGNSGVGKTAIISRYIRKFDPTAKSTIGASFTNKIERINDKQIIFEIWDTAGQERFRSINSIFYQDAYICILVYDITNKKSFEDLKEYWHDSVLEQTSQDIIFHVVGNKIDLFEREVVERDEVEEFCKSINAEASYISAKEETTTYVDVLFNTLGQKFLESDFFRNKEIQLKNNKKDKIKLKDNDSDEKEDSKNKKKCC
jgi:small GTP-binding protein